MGVESATIRISATTTGQGSGSQSISVVANHTVVPAGFHGAYIVSGLWAS